MSETWLSSHNDKVKIVELAQSGFNEKSFPRQSQYHGCGIVTTYNYNLDSIITFKTNIDITHSSE